MIDLPELRGSTKDIILAEKLRMKAIEDFDSPKGVEYIRGIDNATHWIRMYAMGTPSFSQLKRAYEFAVKDREDWVVVEVERAKVYQYLRDKDTYRVGSSSLYSNDPLVKVLVRKKNLHKVDQTLTKIANYF